ncbi:unnamed protein product, partial [Rotaria sp. Silwood2]
LEPLIICYYTNWSQYRDGSARFYPENVDINLCTHIIDAFTKLDNDHISPYEWNDEKYPDSRHGSRPTDKQHFTNLLIELKRAFRPFKFLLTAAVGAGKSTIDAAYEIRQVCQILDFVNLMSYDLHG